MGALLMGLTRTGGSIQLNDCTFKAIQVGENINLEAETSKKRLKVAERVSLTRLQFKKTCVWI
jgi:hypothetical protein